MREAAVPSVFLSELPRPWWGHSPEWCSARRERRLDRLTRIDRESLIGPCECGAASSGRASARSELVQVGDQVMHASFGVGEITHTFGRGEKVSIAVKFLVWARRSLTSPSPD